MADEDNKLNYGLGMAVGAILSVIGAAFGQTVGVYTSGFVLLVGIFFIAYGWGAT
jgi:hypothetical protein